MKFYQQQRFGIRKFAIGIGSVALATVVFLGANQDAYASETSRTATEQNQSHAQHQANTQNQHTSGKHTSEVDITSPYGKTTDIIEKNNSNQNSSSHSKTEIILGSTDGEWLINDITIINSETHHTSQNNHSSHNIKTEKQSTSKKIQHTGSSVKTVSQQRTSQSRLTKQAVQHQSQKQNVEKHSKIVNPSTAAVNVEQPFNPSQHNELNHTHQTLINQTKKPTVTHATSSNMTVTAPINHKALPNTGKEETPEHSMALASILAVLGSALFMRRRKHI
ncbi:YSIRK signal domain/LPXTG anchor domain surface protein [Staphylococcus lugdunensis]|uniref:YSIRK signal domain/LPXTG anchor domain surface protein n=1 Tax=Staphylococcus lugdunensis TaxID=28035 RepID=A0A4V2KW04_STALU|nr:MULTISPECIES: YSIRK signal domain/LPXTG anchor domain surface protein [Staphylococcus]AMG62077.1 YSIRK signal domain/LPXTG anchor domain surface protein [Staphylococcus lugdunensis]ARJ10598.1 YSIRK signal domain/LPXTG anchor domain surface protein [Staphylococcus lugdunensis]AST60937.1 YSIRK signal domain/LPXTG anchor domain surface protein [Staphylococcus lugdunensis]ATG70328.1 YSIRK signal domain/LPXTG anchor domain surface protein [Staphylococcus lugdunensis]ATN15569.1 YSIRK signal domai